MPDMRRVGANIFRNLKTEDRLIIDLGTNFFPMLRRAGRSRSEIELNAFLAANKDLGDDPHAIYIVCLNMMDFLVSPMLHGIAGLHMEFAGAYDHRGRRMPELDETFDDTEAFGTIALRLRRMVYVIKK